MRMRVSGDSVVGFGGEGEAHGGYQSVSKVFVRNFIEFFQMYRNYCVCHMKI